jgi:hypothetical protein
MSPARWGIATALAVWWLAAAPAHAQNAEAEALFEKGNQLFAATRVAEACDAFEASNRIETRAGTLIRLGECREKNNELASAWSAYKDALVRVKDPSKRKLATARVAAIEPRLSYLLVAISDEARIDGLALSRNGQPLDPGVWNLKVPVNGGSYTIVARAPGHEGWERTVTVANEGAEVTVEVPKFKELTKLVPSPTPATQPPPVDLGAVDDRVEAAPPSRFALTKRRKLALGVGGVAAASLATGIVLGLQARSRQDRALALCPVPASCDRAAEADSLNASAHARAIYADVGFAIAGGAAIAAGVLWFTGAPIRPARDAAIIPTVTPDHVGLAVAGGF